MNLASAGEFLTALGAERELLQQASAQHTSNHHRVVFSLSAGQKGLQSVQNMGTRPSIAGT